MPGYFDYLVGIVFAKSFVEIIWCYISSERVTSQYTNVWHHLVLIRAWGDSEIQRLKYSKVQRFRICISHFICTLMPDAQPLVSQSRLKLSIVLSVSRSLSNWQTVSLTLSSTPDPALVIPCCPVSCQEPSSSCFLYFIQPLTCPQYDCSKPPLLSVRQFQEMLHTKILF